MNDEATPSPAPPPPATATTSTTCAVTVAVHIRPLAPHEGTGPPAVVGLPPPTPAALPAASCGGQAFAVDAVYDSATAAAPGAAARHSPPDHRPALYAAHVAPLIAGLFAGVNASVFAYGATGAGKTWTMGSAWGGNGGAGSGGAGIIPCAVADVFATADALVAASPGTAVGVRASFVEVLNEDVRDLLAPPSPSASSSSISIREAPGGGVCLAGAVEAAVSSAAELEILLAGAGARRATQATALNAASSRSHAVVTLTVDMKRGGERGEAAAAGLAPTPPAAAPAPASSFTTAKLQLVDLAGSERAKRTLAGGARLREAAHINMGLLALGNVITALVQQQQQQTQQTQGGGRGGAGRLSTGGEAPASSTTNPTPPPALLPPPSYSSHIPYRASKLTRLLSDALGGSARAVMVACVSPAPGDAGESRATLRWAARARAVRNTPIAQHGDEAAGLRAALGAARAEADALRAALLAATQGSGQATLAPPPPSASPAPAPTPAPALRARIAELEAALAAAASREAARSSASASRRASQRSREAAAAEARGAAAAAARARLAGLADEAAAGRLAAAAPRPLPASPSPGEAVAWVQGEAGVGAAAAELSAAAAAAAARLEAAEAALDALPDVRAGGPPDQACEAAREAAVLELEAAEADAASTSAAAGAAAASAALASSRRRGVLAGAPPGALAALVEAAVAALGRAASGGAAPAVAAATQPLNPPPSPALTPGPPPAGTASLPSPASAWRAQAEGATTRAATIRARSAARAAARGGGVGMVTTTPRDPLRSHPVPMVGEEEAVSTRLVFGALDGNQQAAGTPLGGKLGALALDEEDGWGGASPVVL